MTQRWQDFLLSLRQVLGEDFALDFAEMNMPSGAVGAVLATVWHYPTRHTKCSNIRHGHVLVSILVGVIGDAPLHPALQLNSIITPLNEGEIADLFDAAELVLRSLEIRAVALVMQCS
jgi:hypothetical protein